MNYVFVLLVNCFKSTRIQGFIALFFSPIVFFYLARDRNFLFRIFFVRFSLIVQKARETIGEFCGENTFYIGAVVIVLQ